MHKDTKKEFEVFRFSGCQIFRSLGYRFCVEDFSNGPIAWFITRYDAQDFIGGQAVPENYCVVDCKEEID